MGTVVDTTVFVNLERHARQQRRPDRGVLIMEQLSERLGPDEEIATAMITASQLLHGVHRATPAHRLRREAFVEAVIAAIPALPFDLLAARAHARIWASLAAAGTDIGAHDRIVAATAISTGWQVATANVRHFDPIRGLSVVEITSEEEPPH